MRGIRGDDSGENEINAGPRDPTPAAKLLLCFIKVGIAFLNTTTLNTFVGTFSKFLRPPELLDGIRQAFVPARNVSELLLASNMLVAQISFAQPRLKLSKADLCVSISIGENGTFKHMGPGQPRCFTNPQPTATKWSP